MPISRQDVEHVAHLARLGLTEEEIDRFQDQLSAILDAFRTIQEVDTAAIPPTAQVIPLRNVMREDTVRPSFSKEAILKNAPRREDDFFKIPPVLE